MSANPNTPAYWDDVYGREEGSHGEGSSRDYGPIHEAIVQLVAEGGRVLDVGCGVGLLCRKIAQRRSAARVVGVDFSPAAIAYAAESARGLRAEFRCLDVRTSLRSLHGQFDLVAMCELIEHLDEPVRVVDDAISLLRPGGTFVLTCPHDNEIPDPEHVRSWGHDELFHLLAPYADAVTFRHFAPPWFHVWVMAHLSKR